MNISINQITPRRTDGEITSVTIHFTARTEDGLINLSGSVPIENFTDKIDFVGLEDEVRTELVNRIMTGTLEDE
ncbi:MAG TPA: hypothetical protein VIG73_08390 [Cerasibacillus sp.]|uniref:hypothetical protein n=1 Tax=Cerasibacillus sp. TaxID=2498711 RepID=UPI002F3FF898